MELNERMLTRAQARRNGCYAGERLGKVQCFSQDDMVVANAAGATVRADVNANLQALVSNSSGASAPGTTYAYMWWADTTTGLLKIRNAANNAWITIGTLATTNLALAALASSNNFSVTQYLGDTANAKMTLGLTINQGAADDEAFALKSSDVAHGVTDNAETDTYATFSKFTAATGGVRLRGYSEDVSGVGVDGVVVTEDATRSVVAVAPIMLTVTKKSGTGEAQLAADKNMVAIQNGGGAVKFIFDTDGDSHQDVGTAWTNFDDHEDVDLLTALSVHVSKGADPIRSVFSNFLQYNRKRLEELKLVTFNPDGHHFVNYSQLTRLLVGAVRQVGTRQHWQGLHIKALEETIELLRGEVSKLLPRAG